MPRSNRQGDLLSRTQCSRLCGAGIRATPFGGEKEQCSSSADVQHLFFLGDARFLHLERRVLPRHKDLVSVAADLIENRGHRLRWGEEAELISERTNKSTGAAKEARA